MIPTSGYASIIAAGFGGFIYFSLPRNSLVSLGFAAVGIIGIVFNIKNYLYKNGLLSFLPPDLVELLLEKSLVEAIAEGKLIKSIKAKVAEVLPLFLAQTDGERAEVLSNMSEPTRQFFTRKGIVNNFSENAQKLILPNKIYTSLPDNVQYSYSNLAIKDGAIPNSSNSDLTVLPEKKAANLEKQSKLTSELIAKAVDRSKVKFVLGAVSPKACNAIAITCAILFLLQIKLSKSSRELGLAVVKSLGVISSVLGFFLSIGLMLLHAKAAQYNEEEQMRLKKQR